MCGALQVDGVHPVEEVGEAQVHGGAVPRHGVQGDVPAQLPHVQPGHGQAEPPACQLELLVDALRGRKDEGATRVKPTCKLQRGPSRRVSKHVPRNDNW